MFFLFTRYNFTSGNHNIFAVSLLKFVSFVSFAHTYVAIPNHKTNGECSGSGLASFMILVESNIIVSGFARMNVCIVGK